MSAGSDPSEGCEGKSRSRTLFLVYKWLSSLCLSSQRLPSAHVCNQTSPFYKHARHTGSGPTPITSFQLDYLCEDPVLQIKSHLEIQGIRTLANEFGEDTVQPVTPTAHSQYFKYIKEKPVFFKKFKLIPN